MHDAEALETQRFHAEMLALGALVGIGPGLLPAIEEDRFSYDSLWITVRGRPPHFTYAYLYRERGRTDLLIQAITKDEVLERILADATQSKAVDYELHHRIPGQDERRQWFSLQEELMTRLHPDWGRRVREAHAKILDTHPFRDDL